MDGRGDGKFQNLSMESLKGILKKYIKDRGYSCVIRREVIKK